MTGHITQELNFCKTYCPVPQVGMPLLLQKTVVAEVVEESVGPMLTYPHKHAGPPEGKTGWEFEGQLQMLTWLACA